MWQSIKEHYHEFRVIMVSCIGYLMYITTDLIEWYKTLPDPTNGQSGLVTGITTVTVGAITAFAATKRYKKDDT